jgi:hypothetical protein
VQKDRDVWIEHGGCRETLLGVPMCICNTELLVSKFRAGIPDGWSVRDTINPRGSQ